MCQWTFVTFCYLFENVLRWQWHHIVIVQKLGNIFVHFIYTCTEVYRLGKNLKGVLEGGMYLPFVDGEKSWEVFWALQKHQFLGEGNMVSSTLAFGDLWWNFNRHTGIHISYSLLHKFEFLPQISSPTFQHQIVRLQQCLL